MSRSKWFRVLQGVFLAALLGACGGGGEGAALTPAEQYDAPATQGPIVFSPAMLEYTFVGGGWALTDPWTTVEVTGPTQGEPYITITTNAPVLAENLIDDRPHVTEPVYLIVPFDRHLPEGTHTGEFTVTLCALRRCAGESVTAQGSLPYKIVVLPRIRVTFKVNGVPTESTALRDGDLLEMEASQAVQWRAAGHGTRFENEVSSATAWSATVRTGLAGLPAQFAINALRLPSLEAEASRVFTVDH
jgi:hypothetical protein